MSLVVRFFYDKKMRDAITSNLLRFFAKTNEGESSYGVFRFLFYVLLSSVFLFFGVMIPSFLHWPNKLWFKIGLLLSTLVTPLVMSFLFFVVFSPIGILFKLFNKDLLDQKIDKSSKSYWVLRKNPIGTMKNQF